MLVNIVMSSAEWAWRISSVDCSRGENVAVPEMGVGRLILPGTARPGTETRRSRESHDDEADDDADATANHHSFVSTLLYLTTVLSLSFHLALQTRRPTIARFLPPACRHARYQHVLIFHSTRLATSTCSRPRWTCFISAAIMSVILPYLRHIPDCSHLPTLAGFISCAPPSRRLTHYCL